MSNTSPDNTLLDSLFTAVRKCLEAKSVINPEAIREYIEFQMNRAEGFGYKYPQSPADLIPLFVDEAEIQINNAADPEFGPIHIRSERALVAAAHLYSAAMMLFAGILPTGMNEAFTNGKEVNSLYDEMLSELGMDENKTMHWSNKLYAILDGIKQLKKRARRSVTVVETLAIERAEKLPSIEAEPESPKVRPYPTWKNVAEVLRRERISVDPEFDIYDGEPCTQLVFQKVGDAIIAEKALNNLHPRFVICRNENTVWIALQPEYFYEE